METYLFDKTDDSITIAFKDANLTLITPIMKALEDNPAVEIVRFIETHPELDDRKLYVRVSEGDPADAFKKASEDVAGYFATINE